MSTTTPRLPFDRPDPTAPPPEFARLRSEAPVSLVMSADGQPAWLVTSYETVTAVLTDSRFGMTPPGPVAAGNNTLFQDGEPHSRLRRLVTKAFTARTITALRPGIERIADEYATQLAAAKQPADLVAGFAAPLSITTISEILGVTIEQREHFRTLADTLTGLD
ncbi:MAG: cytochrome P450, partial [Stackebrandtia sp.]